MFVDFNVTLLVWMPILVAISERGQLMLKTALMVSSDRRYAFVCVNYEAVVAVISQRTHT